MLGLGVFGGAILSSEAFTSGTIWLTPSFGRFGRMLLIDGGVGTGIVGFMGDGGRMPGRSRVGIPGMGAFCIPVIAVGLMRDCSVGFTGSGSVRMGMGAGAAGFAGCRGAISCRTRPASGVFDQNFSNFPSAGMFAIGVFISE